MLLLGAFQDTQKPVSVPQVPKYTTPFLCLKHKILELQLEKNPPVPNLCPCTCKCLPLPALLPNAKIRIRIVPHQHYAFQAPRCPTPMNSRNLTTSCHNATKTPPTPSTLVYALQLACRIRTALHSTGHQNSKHLSLSLISTFTWLCSTNKAVALATMHSACSSSIPLTNFGVSASTRNQIRRERAPRVREDALRIEKYSYAVHKMFNCQGGDILSWVELQLAQPMNTGISVVESRAPANWRHLKSHSDQHSFTTLSLPISACHGPFRELTSAEQLCIVHTTNKQWNAKRHRYDTQAHQACTAVYGDIISFSDCIKTCKFSFGTT